jgi:myo-inositol 2-dehydrogenase/D-chiro-inositol 1-dehydrogenase
MRVGIVGCGRMGNERARATIALGHELAVVYDPDVERARTLRAKYSASLVLEKEYEIPWSTLDAIFICTPPGLRSKYELAAIAARLPFFIEKPIAITSSDCVPVLAALSARPTIHAVGYMNRCRDSVSFARQLLAQCKVLGVCCHWVGRKYKVGWWLERGQSGGPLNEQATHAFDLSRVLVGEISSVNATVRDSADSSDLALSVACTLNFSEGPLGTIFYSCEADDKHINLRVITAGGILEFSGWDLRLTANTIDGVFPAALEEDIFVSESARFFTAIQRGDPRLVPCDLVDAYRTQLAVDAARASLRSGERVSTVPLPRSEGAR